MHPYAWAHRLLQTIPGIDEIAAAMILIEIGDDIDTREWAMTMLLAARALERIGDNAVDIGEQTVFLATGEFGEFVDASH